MSLLNLIWLAQLLGPNTCHAKDIIGRFGVDELYSVRGFKEFHDFLSAAQLKELNNISQIDIFKIIDRCESSNIKIITIADEQYPARLSEIENPPVVLYAVGDTKLMHSGYKIAIVGTRTPSKYGIDATKYISTGLVEKNVIIVSGLAEGLDGVAHRVAVAQGTPTIAVLGNPVDVYYPHSNKELQKAIEHQGLVISETAPGVLQPKSSFLLRNRIIAALSDAVLISEARERSGTMNTAKHAKVLNRAIFAIPGSILSPMGEGANRLIYDGAIPAINPETVLKECGLIAKNKRRDKKQVVQGLSPLAEMTLSLIPAKGILSQQLYEKLSQPMPKILACVTELELLGLIEQGVGGMIYKSR